jgi:signal transduction histidine kinase
MSTGTLSPRRLLLIEDNPADADLVREFLEETGHHHYQVVHVSRVGDALRRLLGNHVDVILLDLRLPDVSGVETVKSVRSVTEEVPIIVLTGTDDEELALSCIDAGAQDYLCKGEIHPVSLRRAIGYAITRRAEAKLREDQLQRLVSASPDAVIVAEIDGVVQFANEAAFELFGKTREELVGEPLGFTVPEEHVTDIEIPRRGGKRNAEARAVRFEWKGKPAVLASLRDTTEQRILNEELRRAQKMEAIGRLAGGVAHDFNNMLTVINGCTDLLIANDTLSEASLDLLREVRRAGEKAASLTGQLLAFGRRAVMVPKVIDLNELVRDMQSMLRRLIGEDVELVVISHEPLVQVCADPSQIEQAIMNLCLNARDAMPTGGKILLETDSVILDEPYADTHNEILPGKYAILSISDNGEGMDDYVKSHIFEPFYTTKETGKGTGLGLATTHGIVSQSEGHIAVYSEVGRGTTLRIYLPLVEAPGQEQVPATAPSEAPTGTETILLIEDEEGVRRFSRRVLEAAGYQVLTAALGEDALELARSHTGPIHLLVTDVVMPRMSGPQAAEALQEKNPNLKVLFMSGYTDDAVIRYGVLRAQTPYLAKPFTPAALARKVREILDSSDA